jgi:hypothetical protein
MCRVAGCTVQATSLKVRFTFSRVPGHGPPLPGINAHGRGPTNDLDPFEENRLE